MYLLQLDNTGIVKDDPTNDSWKGISVFRDVVKKHGLKGLTVIALTCDYNSALSYYHNDAERFIRAVEEVYEERNKLKKDQIIAAGIHKYDELQFNTDLEQDRIAKQYKTRLLERIKVAMQDETENGEKEVERLNKAMANYENSNKKFYETFDKAGLVNSMSVTENGYILSRIENDLLKKKNSKFANEGKNLINPNNLGLNSKQS